MIIRASKDIAVGSEITLMYVNPQYEGDMFEKLHSLSRKRGVD